MNGDWRELLERALEGARLTEEEARHLAALLADAETRREARELLEFDAALHERLAPAPDAKGDLSRERLLAKAALREKAHDVRARRGRRHGWLRWAAAAVLFATLYVVYDTWQAIHLFLPDLRAAGSFRLDREKVAHTGPASLSRGQLVTAEAGGAELRLGGYCTLLLDPNTGVIVRGELRHEAVEVQRGRVVSRVEPGRGRFTLLTPRGSIEVKGTEFITSVEYPESRKGESDMGTLKKSAVVTVVVLSGVVACQMGDVGALLGPGMSQVFAGDERERPTLPPGLKGFKGIVIGTITSQVTREFMLRIDKIATAWPQSKAENPEAAVGKTIEMVVLPNNRMLDRHLHTLKTLRQGDQVIVEAFDLQGFRLSVMELLRKAESAGEEPRREGEGERRDKPERREGEGEWREKKPERREGEGEVREKRVEPRAEGLRELVGWVKATPDRDCAGILKAVERVQTEEGVRERAVVYRILAEGDGARAVVEANGRRVVIVGTVRPGEGEIEPAIVVKKLRVLDAPAGEGERRDKPERREGEGEWREKKPERREGEGEWREKKVRGEGEGERRDKPIRREGEGEGEWREKKVRPEGEGERREKVRGEGEGEGREERPAKPSVAAGGPATQEMVEGFRGMIEGTMVGKTEDTLVLRVEKVGKVWQSNTCKTPEALVGKTVTISVKAADGRPREALEKALAELKAGDRVLAGAAHREGKLLGAVEVLRKMDAE